MHLALLFFGIAHAAAQIESTSHRFDFNERERGNFERTPRHWVKLEGVGLPEYCEGAIDDRVGHDAPPSFRLQIRTGNLGYEYRDIDVRILPGSDYLIVAHVLPDRLRAARALLAVQLFDRFGEPIAGTERVSNTVAAGGRTPETWQRVEIALTDSHPQAYALRLQLWILQTHVWRPLDPRAADPILDSDVNAGAWFDDITILRLPRARLQLSSPSGLYSAGEAGAVTVELNRASLVTLQPRLELLDVTGAVVRSLSLPQAPPPDRTAPGIEHEVLSLRAPLEALPAGYYEARFQLRTGVDAILERRLPFVVLPELPGSAAPQSDLGVDVGLWPGGDESGLVELIATLGCGAARIGIPLVGAIVGDERVTSFRKLTEVLRELRANRIEPVGVFRAFVDNDPRVSQTIQDLLASEDAGRDRLNPVLAYVGGALSSWQLGDERIELATGARWTESAIDAMRSELRRFASAPQMIVPRALTDEPSATPLSETVWAPAMLPTRDLAPALLDALPEDGVARWLFIDLNTRGGFSASWLADVGQRLVIAKTAAPHRLVLPAPFEQTSASGAPRWSPTPAYLPLRTALHFLGGRRAVAAMSPRPGVSAVFFEGGGGNVVAVWRNQPQAADEPIELYLGSEPRAFDLLGRETPVTVSDGRARLAVGTQPLFVVSSTPQLALLQASYSISPTHVDPDSPGARPKLRFRNPFPHRVSGEVIVTPPEDWYVEPQRVAFALDPHEEFRQELEVRVPPRHPAAVRNVDVQIALHSPEPAQLDFSEPFEIGLRDVVVTARAFWDGDDLRIEQVLQNRSQAPVSFRAFCTPAGQPRLEGVFLQVPPGETGLLRFEFPGTRSALAGTTAHAGVTEVRGNRTLHQLVEIPE